LAFSPARIANFFPPRTRFLFQSFCLPIYFFFFFLLLHDDFISIPLSWSQRAPSNRDYAVNFSPQLCESLVDLFLKGLRRFFLAGTLGVTPFFFVKFNSISPQKDKISALADPSLEVPFFLDVRYILFLIFSSFFLPFLPLIEAVFCSNICRFASPF